MSYRSFRFNRKGVSPCFEKLEDRRMLANVEVSILNDDVNGDISGIPELIANPGSDNEISLREAILAANNEPLADTITFDPAVFPVDGISQTIVLDDLTRLDLDITDALTITGPGSGELTIDAVGLDSTPTMKDGLGSRLFRILGSATNVDITGLTLTGGDSPEDGGAIHNAATLGLEDVHLVDNAAYFDSGGGDITLVDASVSGGAIYSSGVLTLENAYLASNFAIANLEQASSN